MNGGDDFFKGIGDLQDFDTLKFLFASQSRLEVLLSLNDSIKNINELEEQFDKKHTNLSRDLNELKKSKLIVRLPDKSYAITSYGFLLVKNLKNLMENFCHIDTLESFWKGHEIESLPDMMIKKLSMFNDSELVKSSITEIDRPIKVYLENLKKSKDICMILPVFSNIFMNSIYEALLQQEGHLDLITTGNIYDEILKSDSKNYFDSLVKDKKIDFHIVDEISDIFFTVSDTFSSLFLFFEDKILDQSEMLFITKEAGINDGYRLYNSYKNNIFK